MRQQIIESLISRIKKRLVTERKSDEISLKISKLIIQQFKKKEDFEKTMQVEEEKIKNLEK